MKKPQYDILLVNDDPGILNLVEKMLNLKEITCKTMLDGSEVLKELDEYQPKVVVLDEITPGINGDGYRLCKQIKTNPKLNHIPVFIFGHEWLIKQNLDCKADGYIPYPFDFTDFDPIIEQVRKK